MTIFFEADALAALPLPARLARAWQLLAAVEAADEFAVAIDFAVLHGFVDADFAPHWRGELDAPPRRYWVNPIDGSEMVWIPQGRFVFGADQRRGNAHGFFLARYPVTNAQFDFYLSEMQQEHSPHIDELLAHRGIGHPSREARHPATQVSFLDALGYCRWAGLTLPSEWLWEKAARGTDGRTHPWGERQPYSIRRTRSGIETTNRLAQIRETDTCAVDQFAEVRSPYGCEQMTGNVSEWCVPDDELSLSAAGIVAVPQLLPSISLGQAAVRGSSFKRRSLSRMPSAHRRRLSVTRRNDWVGFRPAFYPPMHRVVRAASP